MAAAGLANYQNFLNELMLSRQIVFGYETPLLAELTGLQRNSDYVVTRDPNQMRVTPAMNREAFHGKDVFVPLQLNDVSSAAIAEGATFPQPFAFDTQKAVYNLVGRVSPISVTKELEDDAKDGSTSAMEAIEAYVDSAYRAHAKTDEDFLHGDGTGLLAAVTSGTGSPGLVIPVGTSANFDQLTPGRIIDIKTRSNGANPGNGLRRKIASVDRNAGTVTVDTNAVASDGNSGNVTFSANEGIYIDGSYSGTSPGANAPAGLGLVCATSGTYGGINKASVAQWQGVNVNAGGVILSDDILDQAVYFLRGNGVGAPDFGIAHPLTIDAYKSTKLSLVRYAPSDVMLQSGFKGIAYEGADSPVPLLKALAAPRMTVRLVYKSSLKLYGRSAGPQFIADDGGQWRFFTRTTAKEADLYDRWQLCARDCGKNASITNLSE